MRLLLDTHVWLWSLLEPERLGTRARGLVEDADTAAPHDSHEEEETNYGS